MSMTQSRKVRRLVGSRDEALTAIKDMNFPRLPVEVLSYPLARLPWGSQRFEKTVRNEEELLAAVQKAVRASEIKKAYLVGWPIYNREV